MSRPGSSTPRGRRLRGGLGRVVARGALAALALAAGLAPASARSSRTLLDNRAVLVRVNSYSPNIRSALHAHAYGRFVYVIAGGPLTVHVPGREPFEVTLHTDDVAWRPSERHALENRGRETVRVLEVEVKAAVPDDHGAEDAPDSGAEDAADSGPSEEGSDGGSGRVAFRNRHGSILFHEIGARETFRTSTDERARLIYWVTRADLRYRHADGTHRSISRAAGGADWHRIGESFEAVNTGRSPIRAIEFRLEQAPARRTMTIRGLEGDGEDP